MEHVILQKRSFKTNGVIEKGDIVVYKNISGDMEYAVVSLLDLVGNHKIINLMGRDAGNRWSDKTFKQETTVEELERLYNFEIVKLLKKGCYDLTLSF